MKDNILKKEFGREIDSHQDVIRFNKSQVKNFEKFVGSKTTVRFVNNPVFECCQSWDNDNPQDTNFVKLLTNINGCSLRTNFLGKSDKDELYDVALDIIRSEGKASTSFLQRKLQIGYNRAARIVDMMEADGVVSKANHVGKRDVL